MLWEKGFRKGVTRKDLVNEKEEIKCNNIIKLCKKILIFFKLQRKKAENSIKEDFGSWFFSGFKACEASTCSILWS